MVSETSAADGGVQSSGGDADRPRDIGRAAFLLCCAGSSFYALPLDRVAEVMRALPVEPMAGAPRSASALSDVTVSRTLDAAGGAGSTVHGFRSSFRDWAAESTSYPRELAQAVQEITDPHFDMDEETFMRLAPIVFNPDVPLERKLAEVEARRREVEALPEIDARFGLRVVLVGNALARIWSWYAVNRDDRERQWEFVLAVLAAAGEITTGVAKNLSGSRGSGRKRRNCCS
jgi:hypothetical protein